MVLVVLEPVQIFVPFSACGAFVRLVFFHTQGARVGVQGLRIDDRKSAVFVGVELL